MSSFDQVSPVPPGGETPAPVPAPTAHRFWGAALLAPVEHVVLWDNRQTPITFHILNDSDEAEIVREVARQPIDLGDVAPPTPGLEEFWREDIRTRLSELRNAAEVRALLARTIVAIDGLSYDLTYEDKLTDIRTWRGDLIDACMSAYTVAKHRPYQLRVEMEQDQDFGDAPSATGAPSDGASPSAALSAPTT
jgi:hypothetical protein